MQCARVQQLMPAAVDGELGAWRRRRFDQHVEGCVTCRREMAATGTVLAALDGLVSEAPVPARLEQDTLRAVRLLAAGPDEPAFAWWRRLGIPVLAAATAAALAVVVGRDRGVPVAPVPLPGARGAVSGPPDGHLARGERQTPVMARGARPPIVPQVPSDPPPALAAAPELFMDMPVLRHLEKLDNFDAIRTTTLGDDLPDAGGGGEERSNG